LTCIVGLEDKGSVWIGADSCGIGGWDIRERQDPKVFRLIDNKKAVLGFTTSFRMGQLLMYEKGIIPKKNNYKDAHHLMVSGVIPNIRKVFMDGGFTTIESNVESGGSFLLGYEGELWTIYNDFQVGRNICGYEAMGSGAEYAIGSLHSTEAIHLRPRLRVLAALRAAAKFNAAVSAPFTIMNTMTGKKYMYKE
jgi:ATP-dependent protease HslVU (ClpYQ) peptidase subunit